ncbi:apolipoprotein N-acyltransferase [Actinokineospora soli]|uniref:Apolipoprotein N-acyltransferase n=1 Tax=Actinokineospora soli TaxID=1048753 RepID=A0ABW2TNC3_9PSEU
MRRGRPRRLTTRRPAARDRPRARVLALGKAATALAGGLAVFLAFPPRPTWWLAPIGFALLGLLLRHARARAGFGYGFLFGLGMMTPLLAWTGEFVGLVAWLPLAAVQALLVAVSTAAIAVVGRLPGWPVWAALLWTAGRRCARCSRSAGSRGARSRSASPGLVPAAGRAGRHPADRVRRHPHRVRPGRLVPPPAAAARGRAAPGRRARRHAPGRGGRAGGEITVAAIQGNVPRAGLDFNAQRRAVLDNHVRRTEELAADVASGRVPRPDLVIWPENSSDIDPYRNADARDAIDRATRAIGVPITVGAVLVDPDRRPRNTVILWTPQDGPVAEYTKRQLQPFGETMPMRGFFRLFTDYVDRANNFRAGTEPVVFDAGGARLAVATCYEVAFDDVVRTNVGLGATLIAVPTNNATFGRTEMTYQQLAMDRVRAVEHGRAVVVAATSGVSAIVAPDGSIVSSTGLFTPDALVERVPLRTATTIAHRLGAWPERVMVAVGLAALAAALVAGRRARRPAPQPDAAERT